MSRPRPSAPVGSSVVAFVATGSLASIALAGPIWDADLVDDAKQSADTAQVVSADGNVTQIRGKLTGAAFMSGGDYIDMYLVRIATPSILKISTAGGSAGGFTQFDSQLFVFRALQTTQGNFVAQAVLANNDASDGNLGSLIGNTANDGSQFTLQNAGLYFIAIANAGVTALNANGGPLWEGLDQPGRVAFGQFGGFNNWGGQPDANVGDYAIRLEGVSGVPSPGAAALLGLAGLAGRRRRR
jgi:MYXO-CTERM domain-containing protein